LQKIVLILLTIVIFSGCSVTRKSIIESNYSNDLNSNLSFIEIVKSQNITNEGFFIQKAEIEILNENGSQKFIATVKFERPDRYLISLKSRTGIEGARIYLTRDSLMVNDRINKKMYFGNVLTVKSKYGIDTESLPVIFGDFIINNKTAERKDLCTGTSINIESNVKGTYLNYIIDCKKKKAISVLENSSDMERGADIKYANFKKIDKFFIPGSVIIKDSKMGIEIKIKIIKVVSPWSGTFKFIPGKGYELIELL
jgi:hypothetical protein